MEIIMKKVSKLTPYDKNAKKRDERQIANVAQSISEMGWKQPIVIDGNGVVIVWHCRLLAAKKLKQKEVTCVVADDLTPEQIKKYRILDNKLAESPWDLDLLAEDADGLDFSGYDLDLGLDVQSRETTNDDIYTSKISTPQYQVTDAKPEISALVDQSKTDALLMDIEGAQAPEEIKRFLQLAAYRHLVFDYHNIAEYYAHAPQEVQELMERSALVIIDYNDAIAGGYVKLKSEIDQMLEEAFAGNEE